eukprot:5582998-Amphidinium_carterae.1
MVRIPHGSSIHEASGAACNHSCDKTGAALVMHTLPAASVACSRDRRPNGSRAQMSSCSSQAQ